MNDDDAILTTKYKEFTFIIIIIIIISHLY